MRAVGREDAPARFTGRGAPDADAADVVWGVHERYDPWRDRVVAHVYGRGEDVVADEGYAAWRAAVRAAHPGAPFTADWVFSGSFPPMGSVGVARAGWWGASVVSIAAVWALASLSGGAGGGPSLGLAALAALAGWALASARGGVRVTADGVRVGGLGAPLWGWHEVRGIAAATDGGRGVRLTVLGPDHAGTATVSRALWPALAGRLDRLGGFDVQLAAAAPAAAWRHASWPGRLDAAAVGVLAGAVIGVGLAVGDAGGALTPTAAAIWLRHGLSASLSLAMVAAAARARAGGWGLGGLLAALAAVAVLVLDVLLGAATGGV